MSLEKHRDSNEPLMSAEERDDGYSEEFNCRSHQRRLLHKNLCYALLLAIPWFLLILLGSWNLVSLREDKLKKPYYEAPNLIYSPVQHLVEYETKIFTTGFPEDPSPYSGEPSPEVDKVWQGLYPSLYQVIPKEEAARLVNKTVIFPHDPQRRYVIELEVFHQLHCLNMVRKATRPDYYKPRHADGFDEDPDLGPRHIAHCIDVIRQGLMCASDISVYTWEWSEEKGMLDNKVKNPHVCRNWNKLAEWANVNTIRQYIDPYFLEPNDPLDPSTWQDGYHGE